MSEMFGLDWMYYDAKRIKLLMIAHGEKINIEEAERKKAERKTKRR